MSQWTHVAGIIRVDGVAHIMGYPAEDERRLIMGAVANSPIPYGSEGPVQYRVDLPADSNSASRGTITIWGDLRDYDDVDELTRWFHGLLAKFDRPGVFPFLIRDAVLVIDEEFAEKKVVCLYDEKKGMKRVSL